MNNEKVLELICLKNICCYACGAFLFQSLKRNQKARQINTGAQGWHPHPLISQSALLLQIQRNLKVDLCKCCLTLIVSFKLNSNWFSQRRHSFLFKEKDLQVQSRKSHKFRSGTRLLSKMVRGVFRNLEICSIHDYFLFVLYRKYFSLIPCYYLDFVMRDDNAKKMRAPQ